MIKYYGKNIVYPIFSVKKERTLFLTYTIHEFFILKMLC